MHAPTEEAGIFSSSGATEDARKYGSPVTGTPSPVTAEATGMQVTPKQQQLMETQGHPLSLKRSERP